MTTVRELELEVDSVAAVVAVVWVGVASCAPCQFAERVVRAQSRRTSPPGR